MQLENGKCYKMRDGRVVGPVWGHEAEGFYSPSDKIDGFYPVWYPDGRCNFWDDERDGARLQYDLVAEADPQAPRAPQDRREAWGKIADAFDVHYVRQFAKFAAAIVDSAEAETPEDAAQIAAYNKLRRGLEHIIVMQDRER